MESFENLILKLLTKKEFKLMQKRYALVKLLQTDLTYREIARQMKISTTTVVRLNQRLKIRHTKTKYIRLDQRSHLKTNIFNKKESVSKRIPWVIG